MIRCIQYVKVRLASCLARFSARAARCSCCRTGTCFCWINSPGTTIPTSTDSSDFSCWAREPINAGLNVWVYHFWLCLRKSFKCWEWSLIFLKIKITNLASKVNFQIKSNQICELFIYSYSSLIKARVNKNLCGRDGRTICGPQRVPKSTCVSL